MRFKMPGIITHYFDTHGNCYTYTGIQMKPMVGRSTKPYYEINKEHISLAEIIQYGRHLKYIKKINPSVCLQV